MLDKKKLGGFATKMDRLGILAFLYVIFYAIILLKQETNIMNWILLIVGLGGFIVDAFIVTETKLKK